MIVVTVVIAAIGVAAIVVAAVGVAIVVAAVRVTIRVGIRAGVGVVVQIRICVGIGIGISIHPFLHTLHNIASSLPLLHILLVQSLMHIRCIPFALTYIGTDIRLESILFVDFLSDNLSHL